MQKQSLTTGEIAKHCQVTHRAVLKWVSSGKIKAYRTPGRHSRINIPDFIDFLNKYRMPVPQEFLAETTHKSKILIVEDDPAIVKVIESILEKSGEFEIQMAYDGFSAGLLFGSFKPDLITLDIQMNLIDGFEVCRKIRSNPENKDVKILIITDDQSPETKERIISLGADEFMLKPISSQKLLSAVTLLLGSKVLK